jgi:hypothetical protein
MVKLVVRDVEEFMMQLGHLGIKEEVLAIRISH